MKQIIAILSKKGGSGKTSTVQALGGELRRQGEKVLLIDLDAQQNLSDAMGARLNGLSSAHILDETPAADAIQHTKNGDIIAASRWLTSADSVESLKAADLKNALRPVLDNYDYILIDCPANFGKLTINALTAATSAILTARPETFSEQGLADIIESVNEIRDSFNSQLVLRGVILTDSAGRSEKMKAKPDEIRAIAADLGTAVIEPPIKHTDKVPEAQDEQINLCIYSPHCSAAKCYRAIVSDIMKW